MRRHTVILGAGATIAAIPNGDKNGRKSSVMNGLIEKLHLQDILHGIQLETTSDNLEDIYSELYCRPEYSTVRLELEKRIYDYFSSLELPDEPTVYDMLILSLTEKDVIATFNWDPLLIQAYIRCHRFTYRLPMIFCLHGNVAVSYCNEHNEFGVVNVPCPICKQVPPPIKLLYPVKDKNYKNDNYIRQCWEATEQAIEESSTITIFGYSAPSSDVEAINLLKNAWGGKAKRQLEEVSIIDIIDEKNMLEKWSDFIYSHHYKYTNNFFNSYLGMFPRRSCEMLFAIFHGNLFADNTMGFHEGMTWDEIKDLMFDLLKEELETPEDKNYPVHYILK